MSNKRPLKSYIRYDGSGRAVSSSLIWRKNKPKVGNWKEVQGYECCNSGNDCPQLPPCFTWNLVITTEDLTNSTGNSGEIVNVLGYDFIATNDTSYDLSILCGSCCPSAGSSGGPIDITFCGSLALGFYFKDNAPVFILGTPIGTCN